MHTAVSACIVSDFVNEVYTDSVLLAIGHQIFHISIKFSEMSSLSWKQIKRLIYVWQLAITP